jgi:rhodanese-related sulfurtransferase
MIRFCMCIAALCLFTLGGRAIGAESFPDISHDDLVQAIKDKKVTLLDANGTDSYNSGHIPGAIDYDANKAGLSKLLPSDKGALIVAYCGSPQCTAYKAAADDAAALGYTNVKHLREGISGWKSSGASVETPDKSTAH